MRKQRKLSEETKQKISASMKNKKKTESHRKALSESMKKYWETIPYECENNEER